MSFENGYNIFDYCSAMLEKYRMDNMIFYKALHVLNYFRGRSDYPYCTEEISCVCEKILGYDLDWLSDFVWKYTVPLGENMVWDARKVLVSEKYPDGNMIADLNEAEGDRLIQNFKNDMEIFFVATTPLFEELFIGDANSVRINKIAVKKTYGDEKTLRIIRKDGESFDFCVNEQDIEKIEKVFLELK